MNIGDVVTSLRQDFPDISVSKVRFLESAGLIKPRRTKSGYRVFKEDDLEKLRFILRSQEESYLPLSVIKKRIELGEHRAVGTEDSDKGSTEAKGLLERIYKVKEEDPLTAGQLAKVTGSSKEFVFQLQGAGLVFGSAKQDEGFSQTDAEIVSIIKELVRMGLEPRHIKAMESGVARESELMAQMITPVIKSRGRSAATEKLEALAETTEKLRKLLLIRMLSEQI